MKYIIIGGTSGIGLATAKLAVAAGHTVVAVGRDSAKFDAARSVGATAAQLDAGDHAATQRFFEIQGAFDHLVLCPSGSAGAGAFRELALEDLREGFYGTSGRSSPARRPHSVQSAREVRSLLWAQSRRAR